MISSTIDNLRSKASGLLRRRMHSAVVLLYHRVIDLECDPQLLAVSPKRFDEQMRLIAREFNPISLMALSDCIRRGSVPDRTVVVTFDDGYEDNLINAKPILEKHDIPATVFVASGAVGGEREFYWDKLEDIFLTARVLPSELAIRIGNEECLWVLGNDVASYLQQSWDVLCPQVHSPHQSAYVALCDKLRPLSHDQQTVAIDRLCHWAGVDSGPRPTHRTMSTDQVRELVTGGLIEVGAHTIDHPILAALPIEEQRKQIGQSKADLQRMIGRPIHSFSYPYGTRSSYTQATVNAVVEAEFTCACSNFPDRLARGVDPYQLPRELVRDWGSARLLEEVGGLAA
jgi:peptidoglycan/xylan/chitin deacetylase (PgdA/CDA1 family)